MVTLWLRTWLTSKSGSFRRGRAGTRRKRGRQLMLEVLENRWVPTITWTGSSLFTNDWSDPMNWAGSRQPMPGENLVFPAGAQKQDNVNDLPVNMNVGSITFTGSRPGYHITGNAITLGGGITDNGTAGTNILDVPLTMNSTLVFTVPASGTLFIRGTISGDGGLSKMGTGPLFLERTNVYGGPTAVLEGSLVIDATNAVAGSGATVFAGASVALRGNGISEDAPLQLAGLGVASSGALQSDGNNQWSGPITLSGETRIGVAPSSELDLFQPINGTGNPMKTGTGTLLMAGNNTYIGTTTVQQGTLEIWTPAALGNPNNGTTVVAGATLDLGIQLTITRAVTLNGTGFNNRGALRCDASSGATWAGPISLGTTASVAAVSPLVISGPVRGNAGAGLTKTGADTLTLSGANTYTGPTNINAGTLRVGAAGTLPTGTAVNVSSGATFDLSGFNTTVFSLSGPGGSTVLLGNGALTVGASSSTFNGVILSNGGTGGVTKAGSGTLTLGGNNNYLGATQIQPSGTLRVNGTQTFSPATLTGFRALTATLTGTGAVASITSSGTNQTLSPGPSSGTGTLRSAGNVTLNSATTVTSRIIGSGSDQLLVDNNGTVNLNDTVLSLNPATTPARSQTFTIISNRGGHPINGFFQGMIWDPATHTASPGRITDNPPVFFIAPSPVGANMKQFYTISYSGGAGGQDVVITFVNTSQSAQNLQLKPDTIDEGGSVTLTGNLVDPDEGDTGNLRVEWGDGTVETFKDIGFDPFAYSHTYGRTGNYTVHVSWFDSQGEGNSRDFDVTVNNVAPTVFAGDDIALALGDSLTRSGSFTDPRSDDTFMATVDYGDGSGEQPLDLNDDNTFDLNHLYDQSGHFQVVVKVEDSDGGVGTGSFFVDVMDGGNRPNGGRFLAAERKAPFDLSALWLMQQGEFAAIKDNLPESRNQPQRPASDRTAVQTGRDRVDTLFRMLGQSESQDDRVSHRLALSRNALGERSGAIHSVWPFDDAGLGADDLGGLLVSHGGTSRDR